MFMSCRSGQIEKAIFLLGFHFMLCCILHQLPHYPTPMFHPNHMLPSRPPLPPHIYVHILCTKQPSEEAVSLECCSGSPTAFCTKSTNIECGLGSGEGGDLCLSVCGGDRVSLRILSPQGEPLFVSGWRLGRPACWGPCFSPTTVAACGALQTC